MKFNYVFFEGKFLPVSVAGKEFQAKIGFSKGIGVNMDIIGRKDIFEHFVVCFDEQERIVTFTPKGSETIKK